MDSKIQQALKKSRRLISRHPERIPVIVIADNLSMKMTNFLPHEDSTVGDFMICIRGYIEKMKSKEALLMFVCGTMPPMTTVMRTLYREYASPDGYLHIHISRENTFG
jgi:hypothetical protein